MPQSMGSTALLLLAFILSNDPRFGEVGASFTGDGAAPPLPCISSSAVHTPLAAMVVVEEMTVGVGGDR